MNADFSKQRRMQLSALVVGGLLYASTASAAALVAGVAADDTDSDAGTLSGSRVTTGVHTEPNTGLLVHNALTNKLVYKHSPHGMLSIGDGFLLSSGNDNSFFASERLRYRAPMLPASNEQTTTEFTKRLFGTTSDQEYIDAHVRQDDGTYRFTKDSTIFYQNATDMNRGAINPSEDVNIDAQDIVLTVKSGGKRASVKEAAAINNESKALNINATELHLIVNDTTSTAPLQTAWGIRSAGGTTTVAGMTEIDLSGTKSSKAVQALGGTVTLEGLTAKTNAAAEDAAVLEAQNDGRIDVNISYDSAGDNTVKLDGNIIAKDAGSQINTALAGEDSYLKGLAFGSGTLNLWLRDGAAWHNESPGAVPSDYTGSRIVRLSGGDSPEYAGVIFQNDDKNIMIGDYEGYTRVFYKHDALTPKNIHGGELHIENAASDSGITLTTDNVGLNTDSTEEADVTLVNETLNALANKLYYTAYTTNERNLTGKAEIAEGLTTSAASKRIANITFDELTGQGGYAPGQTETEFTAQLTGDENKDEEYVDAQVRQEDGVYRFTKDSTITYKNNAPFKRGAILPQKDLKIDASGHVLTIKTGGERAGVTEAAGIRLAPTKAADIKAGTLRLFVNDDNSVSPLKKAYGIQGDKGTLNITGMTEMEVGGTETSRGVSAYMNDTMALDGLRAKVNTAAADAAALHSGHTGRISINVKNDAAGSSTVQLDGNVLSQDEQSRIDVALANSTSYLKGLAYGNGTLNMWLQNGAVWRNVNQGAALPQSYWGSRITSLVGGASPEHAGLIFQNEANTIAIDQYSGHTRAFYGHDTAEPKKVIGGALLINHAAAGSGITMTTDSTGLNTAASASAAEKKLVDETLSALANKLWYRAYKDDERNLTGKVEIAEGLTASSASRRIENITFDAATGKGTYGTPLVKEQAKTEFTTGITGEALRDAEYTDAGVRQEDGSYVFTKDTTITAGETEIKAGAWLTTFSAAVSNSDVKTPVNIDLKGKNLTVNTKTDISTVGITAIGNGAQLNIDNAGAITVNAENTGGAQTAAVYANSGGKVHIKNGGDDLESKVLKVRANNVDTKTNVAVIKTMNGVPGAESNITIDGLVDVLAEGDKDANRGANEAVSAVASTIDIGGGKIITKGDTWAAIRAYGEFVTQNTGVVNFNVKKDASGMAIDASTNRAVIEGDFSTNGGMGTKGRISVGLSTPESYWLGNYVDTHGYGVTQGQFGSVNLFMKNGSYWKGFASGVMNVDMSGENTKWIGFNIENDMKLTLNNGATWYNAITPEQKGWKNVDAISRVKEFHGSGGFIDMTGENRFLGLGNSLDQTGVPGAAVQGKCSAIVEKGLGETGNLEIDEFSGNTTVRYRHDAVAPTTIYGGTMTIKKAAAGSAVTMLTDNAGLNTESAEAADKNLVSATLNALANKLYYTAYTTNERNLTGKAEIAEGLTASSASKRVENITFDETTGQGGYAYTPEASQTTADFTTSITGKEPHDAPYTDAGVRKSDGKYVFTKDSTITTGKDMISAGAWMSNISAAISNTDKDKPLDIDLGGKNLTVNTKTDVSTTGITAIGKVSEVNIKNAGAISIDAESTNYGQTAALFVNSGGAIHIANDDGNLEDKVLKVRANGNAKRNVAVIKSMNGVTGAESKITIDGLVDVLADGDDATNGKGANEAVSAVASTIDIGGGTIKAAGGAWAAIRAYGEFVSDNYGTVNFNVTKGADGLANGAGTNRAIVEGDIVTNGGMGTKGRVSVGLSTADSHWIGNYADTRGYGVTPGQLGAVNLFMKNGSYWKGFSNGAMKVEMSGAGTHWTGFNVGDNMQLSLADGAVWHNAITPEQKDQDNKPTISRVKYLAGSGGFIDMTGTNRFLASSNSLSGAPVQTGSSSIEEKGLGETGDLTIAEYSGDTKVLYRHDAAVPTTVYGGKLTIEKAAAGSAVTLSTDNTGLNTESAKAADKNLVNATLNALANKLYYTAYTTNERNLTGKAEIAEGLTTSSASKRLENIAFDETTGQGGYKYTQEISTDPITESETLTYDRQAIATKDATYKVALYAGKSEYNHTNPMVVDMNGHSLYLEANSTQRGPIALAAYDSAGIRIVNSGAWGIYAPGQLQIDAPVTIEEVRSKGVHAFGVATNGEDGSAPRVTFNKDLTIKSLVSEYVDPDHQWDDGRYLAAISAAKNAHITVKGNADIQNVKGSILRVTGEGGIIDISGGTLSTAEDADHTKQYYVVQANVGTLRLNSPDGNVGNKKMNISGDMNVMRVYGKSDSAQLTPFDSKGTVAAALTTADSDWTGAVTYDVDRVDSQQHPGAFTAHEAGQVDLTLQNGATWTNMLKSSASASWQGSRLTHLTGGSSAENAGMIFQKNDKDITVDNYSGHTRVFYGHDVTAPTTMVGGSLRIKNAAENSGITLTTDSVGLNTESKKAADKNLVSATLNALANKLYYTAYTTNEHNLTGKVEIAEGLTASSASKRLENITFDETTGQGGYAYTPAVDPPPTQEQTEFTTPITGDAAHDIPYVNAGIRRSDGQYIFTKDTTIRTDDTETVSGGPWAAPTSPAISNVNTGRALDIDLNGKKLNIEHRGNTTVVGINAIGKDSQVNVKNPGAITISGTNTDSLYAPTLYVNGGGSIHIQNGGDNLEDKVLTLRTVGKKEASPAVIKSMNGASGVESSITIDGLVDLLADGTYPGGLGANEGVSAVASRVDIGGGSIRATGSAWAAIRAYGEFVTENYGTVNFNVTKGADGLANGAGKNRAVLEGDIVTNGGMGTKGRVSIGLSTPESHWIGNYADTHGYGVTQGQLGVVNLFMKNGSYWKGFSNGVMNMEMSGAGTRWTGFNIGENLQLNLANGAVWYNAITPEQKNQDGTSAISRVKHFSGSGGFIDMTGTNRFLGESTSLSGHFVKMEPPSSIIEKGLGETGDLTINSFSGDTKVLYRHDAASPTTVYGGKLTVEKAAEGSAITLSTDSVGLNTESTKAADKNLVSATLNALANKLYYTAYTTGEKNLSGKAEIAEGLTTSAASKRLENITFSKASGQGSYAYTPAVDPKPDTPKPDTPKPDTPKPDVPKPDTPKPDTPKPDTPKPDTPKPDTPKPDTPKPDTPKPDVPKPDAPKPDTPKPDTPKPDTPKPDTPKPDTPKPDTPKPDTPKPDTPKPDTPKPDVPKPDTPKPDTPKPDTPKPDTPKPDTPKPDTPKPDTPKPDTPKPDTPKPDVPKPDTPRPDPKIEYGDYETKLMSGVKSAMTASTMAWRAEANDLMKRMGDLRLSPQDAGVWARVYRGKATSNKDNANFRMNYSTIQVGYDKKVGDDWRVGVAGSYMSGSSSYTAGNGKNKEGNLGVYGTWTGKSGQYVDLIAKIGRLQNEYTVYNDFGHYVKGDYTMWGGSLSAEYGKRIAMTGGTFVEPQVELIYSHMQGKSYVGSTDFRGMSMYVHQKPFDSFIGRVGFGIGKETERSTCYARVSLYHEFAGDMHTDYSDGFTPKSTVQRGSDTWVGVQLGGTMKLNDRTNLYGNFEKTFGGDIQTAWRMDAGLRWNF